MTLTMLSPVHIGTGEEIEPTEYVVREANGGVFFYAVDFPKFVADLSDRDRIEFNRAIDHGGTVTLRRFLADRFDAARHVRWAANANPDLLDAYRRGLDSDRCQLIVHPMMRDAGSGRAYLPGSSIKGALRTAWVSAQAGRYQGRENLDRIDPRDFEGEVLGYRDTSGHRPRSEIRADPFRAVRVGDAPLCADSNAVDPVRITRRVREAHLPDPGGIQMFYDLTFSLVDDEQITATGRLMIDEPLQQTPVRDGGRWSWRHGVAGTVSVPELLQACNTFYRPKLEEDHRHFLAGDPERESVGRKLLDLAAQTADNEALIRLGRFSHFECVTVDRYRRAPRRGAGATRSLSCGLLPMGWARIRLDPL